MAIGPESRRMASGRVVVIAMSQVLLGALAVLGGIGPQVRPADSGTQAAGWLGVALGAVLLIGGTALGLRTRSARRLGMAGAVATIAVGALVAFTAIDSVDTCSVERIDALSCQVLVTGIALVGIAIIGLGAAAAIVLHRARPDAFRRRRR